MLEDLKQQVCQANLDLVSAGLVTLTWGNVSGRSEDGKHFVIKPSGVAYDVMRPEHMVVLDLATGETVEGELRPSSDTATHRLLYQAWPGVGGITHTHSPKATAFAQARRELPCYGTTHADHFSGTVPVARPLTQEEIDSAYEANTGHVIIERFADLDPIAIPAVLVASHAPFAWGKNAAESVKNAIALEACAAMAIDSLALNPALGPVEAYLLDKHYQRKHGPGAYYGQKK
ncbi:L-ribulose-5-phosphate 4-epimerase [Botrimarina colliarenosi]|uniref:L-ribulose-5-phosphate 4-epimerase n=1 Tax=Botrimarina colliarenosi TaxID=2528001 RepID=A0A5C6A6X9_9BACT|nr:L-ribulose-5-phosphate 4-epimerase AraD [Botrimarina colliarenosi]TWT94831.1 L-ribulose-5-phosphate 4-epimerase [Botrimarina colliarenosi]